VAFSPWKHGFFGIKRQRRLSIWLNLAQNERRFNVGLDFGNRPQFRGLRASVVKPSFELRLLLLPCYRRGEPIRQQKAAERYRIGAQLAQGANVLRLRRKHPLLRRQHLRIR
jgi:hypothetical protein